MNSKQFQFPSYTPAEFEHFRELVLKDGFSLTQNTIDTVSGHIGALVYLTGSYNRNQQVLTVTVKTSPWQSFQETDVESNVKRVVQRDKEAAPEHKVNPTPIKSAPPAATLGTNKNIATPALSQKITNLTAPKPAEVELKTEESEATKAENNQTPNKPVPAQTPKPAQAAAATPTK